MSVEKLIERHIHNIAEDRKNGDTFDQLAAKYRIDAAPSTMEQNCKKVGLRYGYDMKPGRMAEYKKKMEGLTDDVIVGLFNEGGRKAVVDVMKERGLKHANADAHLKRLAANGRIEYEQPERKRVEWAHNPETPGRIKAAIYTDPPSLQLGELRVWLFRRWA